MSIKHDYDLKWSSSQVKAEDGTKISMLAAEIMEFMIVHPLFLELPRSTKITVEFVDSILGTDGVTKAHGCATVPCLPDNTIAPPYGHLKIDLNIFEVDQKLFRETMFHELIHIHQVQRGDMWVSPIGRGQNVDMWKGKAYGPKFPYARHPWEMEANEKAEILDVEFVSQLEEV